jgi:predicted XRE-type DNA-binding protein
VNLSPEPRDRYWQEYFRHMAQQIEVLEEHYIPSQQVSAKPAFARLGLTDTSLSMLARDKFLVLTDDALVENLMYELEIDVINFNHLRSAR